jgi:putative component of toxin-antitoxin plasmid stabilization module
MSPLITTLKTSGNQKKGASLMEWALQIHDRPDGSIPYQIFRERLDTYTLAILDICVEEVLARQGNNVCNSSWGKSLGDGLYEFRISKSIAAICNEANVPIPKFPNAKKSTLLRVFFAVEGSKIIVLLCAYDKGKDSGERRQQREIVRARKYLQEHKANNGS